MSKQKAKAAIGLPTTTTATKTTKPVETEAQKALRLQIEEAVAAQVTDRLFAGKTIEDLIPRLEKEVTFVAASNGLFKITKKPIGLFIEEVEKYEAKLPGVGALEAGVHLTIPKIPGKYLIQILSWYRDVERRDHTEASNLFFWNHNNVALPQTYENGDPIKGLTVDGQLVMYCPKQTNSAALSEFHMDKMVPWLRENLSLLLEIHSHNTMGAFFSGTDNDNENMTQFYAVWGRVLDKQPAFTMRYVVGNTRVIVPMSYVFDIPRMKTASRIVTDYMVEGDLDLLETAISVGQGTTEDEEEYLDYQGPWAQLEYPADWMEQHSKRYTAPASTAWSSNAGKDWDPVRKMYVERKPGVGTCPALGHTNYRPIQRAAETGEQYATRLDLWTKEEARLAKARAAQAEELNRLGKGQANLKEVGSAVGTASNPQAYYPEDEDYGYYGTGASTQDSLLDFRPGESEVELRFQDETEEKPDVVEAIQSVFDELTASQYPWELSAYYKDPSRLM